MEGLTLLLRDLRRARQRRAGAPPEEQLRALADAYLRFAQRRPNYFRLIMAFDRGRFQEQIPQELSARIVARSNQCLGVVSEVLKQGMDAGAFQRADPWLAAGILWAGLNGVLVLFASPVRREMLRVDLEAMFHATCDLLLKGLRNDARPG